MTTLTLVDVHTSQVDKTRKFIYSLNRPDGPVTIEVGAIQKGDGKDILCVPTQTNCAQACKFCHTTGMAGKVAVTNLSPNEMTMIVMRAWNDAEFHENHQPLLVSFMGVGEPATNLFSLIRAMSLMKTWAVKIKLPIRWGMATMLPEKHIEDFARFTTAIGFLRIPLKVHLSLHYPSTKERKEWMPAAAEVPESIAALQGYRKRTGNPIEIHYTLIAGVNDSLMQAHALANLIADDPIVVKLLQYNPMPGDENRSPDPVWTDFFRSQLAEHGIESEYYASPGADIQAACGMFLTDVYIPTKRVAELVILDRERPSNSIDLTELNLPLSKIVLQRPDRDFPPLNFFGEGNLGPANIPDSDKQGYYSYAFPSANELPPEKP